MSATGAAHRSDGGGSSNNSSPIAAGPMPSLVLVLNSLPTLTAAGVEAARTTRRLLPRPSAHALLPTAPGQRQLTAIGAAALRRIGTRSLLWSAGVGVVLAWLVGTHSWLAWVCVVALVVALPATVSRLLGELVSLATRRYHLTLRSVGLSGFEDLVIGANITTDLDRAATGPFRLSIGRLSIEPRFPSIREPLKRKLLTVHVERIKVLFYESQSVEAVTEPAAATTRAVPSTPSTRTNVFLPYGQFVVRLLAAFTGLLFEFEIESVIVTYVPKGLHCPIIMLHVDRWKIDTVVKGSSGLRLASDIEVASVLAPFRIRTLSPHFRPAVLDFVRNVDDCSGFDLSFWSATSYDPFITDDGISSVSVRSLSSVSSNDDIPYVSELLLCSTPTMITLATRLVAFAVSGFEHPSVRINIGQIQSDLSLEDVQLLRAINPPRSPPTSSRSTVVLPTETDRTVAEALVSQIINMAFVIELFVDNVSIIYHLRRSSTMPLAEAFEITLSSSLARIQAHPSVTMTTDTSAGVDASAGVELGLSLTGLIFKTNGTQQQVFQGRLLGANAFVPLDVVPKLAFSNPDKPSLTVTRPVSLQLTLDGLRVDGNRRVVDLVTHEYAAFTKLTAARTPDTSPRVATITPLTKIPARVPHKLLQRLVGVHVSTTVRIIDVMIVITLDAPITTTSETFVAGLESASSEFDLTIAPGSLRELRSGLTIELRGFKFSSFEHAIELDRTAYMCVNPYLQGHLLAIETVNANAHIFCEDILRSVHVGDLIASTDVFLTFVFDGLVGELSEEQLKILLALIQTYKKRHEVDMSAVTSQPTHISKSTRFSPRKLEVGVRAKSVAFAYVTPEGALIISLSSFIVDRELEQSQPDPSPTSPALNTVGENGLPNTVNNNSYAYSPSLLTPGDRSLETILLTPSPLPANRLVMIDLAITVADIGLTRTDRLVVVESLTGSLLRETPSNVVPIAVAISQITTTWTPQVHVTLVRTLQAVHDIATSPVVKASPAAPWTEPVVPTDMNVPAKIKLMIATIGRLDISLTMAEGNEVGVSVSEVAFVSTSLATSASLRDGRFVIDQVQVSAGGNERVKLIISKVEIPVPTVQALDRTVASKLCETVQGTNAEELRNLLLVEVHADDIIATIDADFAAWVIVEDTLNTIKALQRFHHKPSVLQTTVPVMADRHLDQTVGLRLVIKTAALVLHDIPFEARLARNYRVGKDEQMHRMLRDQALLNRLTSLHAQNLVDVQSVLSVGQVSASSGSSTQPPHSADPTAHTLLSDHTTIPREQPVHIQALYTVLQQHNASTYRTAIQSHLQREAQDRTYPCLFRVDLGTVDGYMLVPPSVFSRTGLVDHLKRIDPTSNWNQATEPQSIQFDFLYGAHYFITAAAASIQLRDYPLPMLTSSSVMSMGTVVFAEELAPAQSRRTVDVMLWPGPQPVLVHVTRTATPVKTFFDMDSWLGPSTNVSYGISYEGALSETSEIFGALSRDSDDPSPRLPFWDKLRILLHGRHRMQCESGSLHFLATTDPYKTQERLEIRWPKPFSGTLHSHGFQMVSSSFDAFVHTNGCHDGALLLQAGQTSIEATYVWACNGDPDAHHRIYPTPISNIPPSEHTTFDTYASFRSSSLAVVSKIVVDNAPEVSLGYVSSSNGAMCLRTYSGTLLWLERFLSMLATRLVPARRGSVFKTIPRRVPKKKLSKHLQGVEICANVGAISLSYCHSLEQPLGMQFRAHEARLSGAIALLPLSTGSNSHMSWMARWARMQMRDMHGYIERSCEAEEDIEAAGSNLPQHHYDLTDFSVGDYVAAPDLWPEFEDLYEFISAPLLDYCLSNTDRADTDAVDAFGADQVQLELAQQRLAEIEHLFERLSKGLADVHAHENAQDSQRILQSTEALASKRRIVLDLIQKLEKRIQDSAEHTPLEPESSKAAARYTTRYILHSPRGVWSRISRDSILRLFYIFEQDRAVLFSLSRTALHLVRQFVANNLEDTHLAQGTSSDEGVAAADQEDDPHESEDDANDMPQRSGHMSPPVSPPAIRRSHTWAEDIAKVDKTTDESTADGGDLLNLLLATQEKDGRTGVVVAPDFVDPAKGRGSAGAIRRRRTSSRNAESVLTATASDEAHASPIAARRFSDAASLAPSTPTMGGLVSAAKRFRVAEDVFIELLHPQVYFESTHGPGMGYILYVAERTTQSIRNYYEMTTQQHYKKVIEGVFSRGKFFVGHLPGMEGHWPVWSPIECITNDNEVPDKMTRVMNCNEIRTIYSNGNPLFVPTAALAPGEAPLSPFCRSMWEIHFPTFVFVAENEQYNIVYDVVHNLLLYKEPRRKHDANLLETKLYQTHLGRVRVSEPSFLAMQNELRHLLHNNDSIKRDLFLARSKQKINEVPEAADLRGLTEKALLDELDTNGRDLAAAKQSLVVLLETIKRMGRPPSSDKVDMDEQFSWTLEQVVWGMQRSDTKDENTHKTFIELQMHNVRWNLESANDGSGINLLEVDQVFMVNRLPEPVFQELIAPYNPTRQVINFRRHKMVHVLMKNAAPVAGIPVIELFEMNIHPIVFRMTNDLFHRIQAYLFQPWNSSPPSDTNEGAVPLRSVRKHDTLGGSALSVNELEEDVPSPRGKPQHSAKRSIDETSTFVVIPDDRSIPSVANSMSASSGRGQPLQDDVNEMKERASNTRVFIYIQIPKVEVSVSYKGEKEKSFKDVTGFVMHLPALQYHNKTWRWVDFWTQVKKDMTYALLKQTGSLLKEKLFSSARPKETEEHTESLIDPDGNFISATNAFGKNDTSSNVSASHTSLSTPSEGNLYTPRRRLVTSIFGSTRKKSDPTADSIAGGPAVLTIHETMMVPLVDISSSTGTVDSDALEGKKRILWGKQTK